MTGAIPAGPPNSLGLVPGVQDIRPVDRVRLALREELEAAGGPVAGYYRAQGYRPLWIERGRMRPQASQAVRLAEGAAADGLDPSRYPTAAARAALAAAAGGDPRALARAEVAVSTAFSHYIADLHRAPPGAAAEWRDPGLPPPLTTPRAVLDAAARAPDAAAYVAAMGRMHPIYEALRTLYVQRRAAHGGDDPLASPILANMARARVLPGDRRGRYVLVDVAARRLWAYEDGRPVDSMRVIVGRTAAQTPTLAAVIRSARFQPYWNVPADVTRDEIAPHVLREGPAYLARERMEVLSDWSGRAHVVDPGEVDWRAVAAGTTPLRVRSRPGDWNILGRVKLMAPNPLGVYLHDTPNKGPFVGDARALSHGCIRLEDAMRLTRWLLGPKADDPPPGPEARVDLDRPVPVYVVYMTAVAGADGLERRPDLYGRDPALIAELPGRARIAAAD
jgi:murein L,D-transpeptidase YcbB/YkuD